jgi:hypothetical protein
MKTLKCSLVFKLSKGDSVSHVIFLFLLVIAEHKGKFFFCVQQDPIYTNPEYVIKKCRTYLEAGLLWREFNEGLTKNWCSQLVWFREITAITPEEKELCKKLINGMIRSGKEYDSKMANPLPECVKKIITP